MADVKAHFSAYLKASADGPVVVTRNGQAVAALVAVGDEEDLERLLMAHSPKLQAILGAARQRFRAGAGIPHDVFWKEVEAETGKRTEHQTKRNAQKRAAKKKNKLDNDFIANS